MKVVDSSAAHSAGEVPDSLPDSIADLLPEGTARAEINAALPALYNDLRELAAGYLRRERSNHTLQPTALVHESYLRLVNQRTVNWNDRLQVLSIAARMMRRILSDHADTKNAAKRGGDAITLQLDAALEFSDSRAIKISVVDQALRDLETLDSRQANIVELLFFGGLTIRETAELMALSEATIKREWVTARHWLQREIARS